MPIIVFKSTSYIKGFILVIGRAVSMNLTICLLTALGFKVNFEKSVLLPTQQIKFLGFILDSVTMTLSLPEEGQFHILALCKKLCFAWSLAWCITLSCSGKGQKCWEILTNGCHFLLMLFLTSYGGKTISEGLFLPYLSGASSPHFVI